MRAHRADDVLQGWSMRENVGSEEDMGARDEALQIIKESVGIYRQLYKHSPAAFTLEFARSLGSLATCLSNVGLKFEALHAIQEAVAMHGVGWYWGGRRWHEEAIGHRGWLERK